MTGSTRVSGLLVGIAVFFLDLAPISAQSLHSRSATVSDTETASIQAMRRDFVAYRAKLRRIESPYRQQWAIVDLLVLLRRAVTHKNYARNTTLQNLRSRTVSVLRGEQKRLELEARRIANSQSIPMPSRFPAQDVDTGSHWLDRCNGLQGHHANAAVGGPLATFGFLPGNRGPGFDYQSLMDLIEVSIQPEVWRVNGGDATITIYDPAVAMVVSAPWSVQDEIEDLLIMLR